MRPSDPGLTRPVGRLGRRTTVVMLAISMAVLSGSVGCGGKPMSMTDMPTPVGPSRMIPSYDNTVGFYGDIPANQQTLIRGYGLVLLPTETGSRECPPAIRKIIFDQLTRLRVGETTSILGGVRLEQWIDSPQTAVVEVRGMLPSGALRDEKFDVLVTALPGTQTISLEGGVLISTELSIWKRGMTGGLIHGKKLANASGPIFINPFAQVAPEADMSALTEDPMIDRPAEPQRQVGTPVDPRRGWVLGGAEVSQDQPIYLVFREPNYQVASITQEQLNTRFPSNYLHGVAHSSKPSTVELKVPPEYRNQVSYWLALVQQVYLRREPGFLEKRMLQLKEEMHWPDSNKVRVALSFITIGKPAAPIVRTMYDDADPSVSFHAAYAGLKLGDGHAYRKLLQISRDKTHPQQLAAILSMGENHRFRNIAPNLVPILDEENPIVRAAAYQSMDNLDSGLIQREWIGQGKLGFRLDIVPSGGPFLAFVTRTGEPRIVLFGGDRMTMMRPTFLHSERTGVTIDVKSHDDQISLIRRDPRTGQLMIHKFIEKPVFGDDGKLKMVPDPADASGNTLKPMTQTVPITTFKLTRKQNSRDPESQTIVERDVPSMLIADMIRLLGSPPRRDQDNELTGLGLNYSQVVSILYELSRNAAIPAAIYLQPLSGVNTELAGGDIEAAPSSIESAPDIVEPSGPAPGTATQPTDSSEPSEPSPFRIEAPTSPPKIGG